MSGARRGRRRRRPAPGRLASRFPPAQRKGSRLATERVGGIRLDELQPGTAYHWTFSAPSKLAAAALEAGKLASIGL